MDHESPTSSDEDDSTPRDESSGESGDAAVDAIPDAGETEESEVVVETTSAEEAALGRARAVSDLLDEAVRVPGTDFRVGLDPVLGVVSGYGDAVAAAISLYPVFEAYRLDAPRRTLAKMLTLVAIDFAVGSIPIVGTAFDAVWKANEWNVRSLERHVEGA